MPLLAALLGSRGGGQARSPRDAGRRTLLATDAPAADAAGAFLSRERYERSWRYPVTRKCAAQEQTLN